MIVRKRSTGPAERNGREAWRDEVPSRLVPDLRGGFAIARQARHPAHDAVARVERRSAGGRPE